MGWFDKLRGKRESDPRVAVLLAQLTDADAARRAAAAVALGELGAAAVEAQPALEEAIADSDGDVCLAASDALSRIRKDLH